MAHDVFISYAEPDRKVADAACHALEAAGIRCWMAPRDVPTGAQYAQAIIAGIEGCRLLVLIFSSRANLSDFVAREVERAASKRKVILPFRIENVPPAASLELFIAERHWLDALTPPLEARLGELAEAARSIISGTPPPDRRRLPAPSPLPARAAWPVYLGVLLVLIGAAWGFHRALRPTPAASSAAEADVALASLSQRIRHLDRRLSQVKSAFGHERVRQEAAPPANIVGNVTARAYRESTLRVRAEGVERLAAETPLTPPLTEGERLRLVRLGAGAESLEALEDHLRRVEKQTAEFATDLRAGAAEVGRGAVEEARSMDFLLWRVELAGLRIEADALRAQLEYLRVLRGLAAGEFGAARAAITQLASLQSLRPAAELTEELERRAELEIRALDAAVNELQARLLQEARDSLDREAAKLDAIVLEHDDFKILPRDAPDRVITKAVVARSMGRLETAIGIFEEYARKFEPIEADARRYAEVAKAFTLDPERIRDNRSGTYIYTVLAESPLHGMLLEGDVIEFADGTAVIGSASLMQLRADSAGKEVEISVFRLEEGAPRRFKFRFVVPVQKGLGVGAVMI